MLFDGYKKLKVLVVDDFPAFRRTIEKMVDSFGVEFIDLAATGKEAIKLCEQKTYDVILCDYNLGAAKNGQQILDEVRFRGLIKPRSLFLLLTAEASPSMVMATYDNEPDAYIAKPFNAKILGDRLDALLCQRKALLAIYQALEVDDKPQAIERCEEKLGEGGRNALVCRKILGKLYLATKQYDKARDLFETAQQKRSLDWAQVGLATAMIAQNEADAAEALLQSVIDNNPMCMQAYDCLIDLYEAQEAFEQAQVILEKAVSVSPLSLLRQQHLATLAQSNRDLSVAAKAYREAIQQGTYSIHDKGEYYLAFAQVTAALFEEDADLATRLQHDAISALNTMSAKFGSSQSSEAQRCFVASNLYAGLKNRVKSSELMEQGEEIMASIATSAGVDVRLDHIAATASRGETDKAKLLLNSLADECAKDESALEKIDALLDEPRSQRFNEQIARVNKEGVGYFKQEEYQKAIALFSHAGKLFPKHVGIHLNLVQALFNEMKKSGKTSALSEQCIGALSKIEKVITPAHAQYPLYEKLTAIARQIQAK
jgi:CheY-like chemotaxis protein